MPFDSSQLSAYIARAAPWARPILERIRRVVRKACPDIQERLKWNVPSFEKNGMVVGMAAFKAHVAFGFWRAKELDDPAGILRGKGKASFMGERVTDVSQLPADDILIDYIRRAVALNARRASEPRKPSTPRKPRPEAAVPSDLADALRKNAKARAAFEAFPPSHRREYIEWIEEAKQDRTRARRLATTLEWLTQGKDRNWKYRR